MELKRGDRVRVYREKVKYIALIAVPVLKQTQNLVISRCGCAGTAKNVQKSMMHVQSCFAHLNLLLF